MKYFEFFKMLEKKDHLIKRANMTDEQKNEAIAFFNKHPSYEKELGNKWNKPELLTWDDFEEIMGKERVSKSQLKNFVKEGTHYLKFYEDSNIAVYQPLTWMGARYLASKDVAPGIEGEWCISYQKSRSHWNKYSFNNKKVFLILCTKRTKWAVEIPTSKGRLGLVFWDNKDNETPESSFYSYITDDAPNAIDLIRQYIPIAVNNYSLVKAFYKRDLKDTEIFEELQRKAEEERIKSFPKSFQRQVAKKGYYKWDEDLNPENLKKYGLISEDGKYLDERIRYFKVKGKYILDRLPIKKVVWPLYIDSGVFSTRFCKEIVSVTIPDGIASISDFAFEDCSSLKEIAIPDSVTSIGICAFWECSSLTEITVPSSVTSIGRSAFKGCSSLTEMIIPDNVNSISQNAFKGCSSLTSVAIPDSVVSISDFAFLGCSSLAKIVIPSSATSIGKEAFGYCTSLTSVNIPSGVTKLRMGAFGSCAALTKVTIPDSVTSVGSYAFDGCYALKSVYIDQEKNSLDLSNARIPEDAKIYWKGKF